MRPETSGNGQVNHQRAEDISTKLSKVTFEVLPTPENINRLREIKLAGDRNICTITDLATSFKRTWTQINISNNYDIKMGSDSTITVEFDANTAQ